MHPLSCTPEKGRSNVTSKPLDVSAPTKLQWQIQKRPRGLSSHPKSCPPKIMFWVTLPHIGGLDFDKKKSRTLTQAPFTQDAEVLANVAHKNGTHCCQLECSHSIANNCKQHQRICKQIYMQICLLVLCERGLRGQTFIFWCGPLYHNLTSWSVLPTPWICSHHWCSFSENEMGHLGWESRNHVCNGGNHRKAMVLCRIDGLHCMQFDIFL